MSTLSFTNPDRRAFLAALAATGVAAATASSVLARKAGGRRFFQRIGRPIGLQLYALGDKPEKDMDGTLAKLAALGMTDIELPGFYGRSPADLRTAADKAGVRFSSIHINVAGPMNPNAITLDSAPQHIADALNRLGIYQIFLPICPMPDGFVAPQGSGRRAAIGRALEVAGVDHWKRTADLLNRRGAALKPFGIKLGYHNHNMEFLPLAGGQTGWEVLMAETSPGLVNFELDLGWTAAAGLDPAAELAKLNGRVAAVHVKDIKPTQANYILDQNPTEVGSGTLDWRTILPAAEKAGVRHYYVEQEPPFAFDRLEAVSMSHAYLSKVVA